jgi:predicted outer membrane repeat protein
MMVAPRYGLRRTRTNRFLHILMPFVPQLTIFVHSIFADNSALYGGAMYHFGDTISLVQDCKFYRNTARNSGGAVRTNIRAAPRFERCLFEENSAGDGGAFSVFSETLTTIADSTFFNNRALSFGGAMEVQYPLTLSNTSFIGNKFSGGTIYVVGSAPVSIDSCTFRENAGNSGGGILLDASELVERTFSNLVFSNNSARVSGAAIQTAGLTSTTLVGVVCEGNRAYAGGCFSATQSSSLTFVGGRISNNVVTSRGGAGVFSDNSRGLLQGVLVLHNSALSQAGGVMIDVDADVNLNQTVFRSNFARYGGAVALSDVASTCPTSSAVTFSNNSAIVAGGAIFFDTAFPVCTIAFCSRCTYTQNTAMYGADTTTRPASIAVVGSPSSSIAPLQPFDVSIELRDYFAVAVKRVRGFAASMQLIQSESNNTKIAGVLDVDVDDEGVAKFSFIKLSARPGSQVILAIDTAPETTRIFVNITMAGCLSGAEVYITETGEYTCLTRIDTSWQVQITFIVIASFFSLISIIVIILVLVYRSNPVLRRSSILFCFLISLGALLLYASVYMFLWNTDATCALRPWILVLGFALTYGSLFIKEWRLWRLFDVNINSKIRIDDSQLMKGLSLLIVGELGILIVWFAISPFILRISPNLTAETITYACGTRGTPAIFWILLGFNALLLLGGCIIAFLVRNLPDSFNESRFMAFAIYTVSLVIIVCFAISGTLYQPNVVSVVASIGILFSTTVTLGGLFVPKFLFVFFKDAMVQSLIDEVDRLNKDIRWKQKQITELQSGNSANSKSGSTASTTVNNGSPSHSKYSLQEVSGH